MRYRIALALAVVSTAGPTFAQYHLGQLPSTASYNSYTVVKTGSSSTSTEIHTDAVNLRSYHAECNE